MSSANLNLATPRGFPHRNKVTALTLSDKFRQAVLHFPKITTDAPIRAGGIEIPLHRRLQGFLNSVLHRFESQFPSGKSFGHFVKVPFEKVQTLRVLSPPRSFLLGEKRKPVPMINGDGLDLLGGEPIERLNYPRIK